MNAALDSMVDCLAAFGTGSGYCFDGCIWLKTDYSADGEALWVCAETGKTIFTQELAEKACVDGECLNTPANTPDLTIVNL